MKGGGNDSGGSGVIGIGEDDHEIELRVDHGLIERWNVGGEFPGPDPGILIPIADDDLEGIRLHEYRLNADRGLQVRVPIEAGQRLVTVAFTDSNPTPFGGAYGRPGIDRLFISGPFDGTAPDDTPSRQRIFICRPAGDATQEEERCAGEILANLARQAYRRPVTGDDVAPLMDFYRLGRAERDFDGGIERALEALLSMPEFLLRIERQPRDAAPAQPYRLSDLELASRLSFFLWRSIPDDELVDLAAAGRLSEPDVLQAQVDRMLADRRATRFMHDFAGQWLQVRNINEHVPDSGLYGAFNDTLRRAMVTETELFFESQMREDRPIPELLRADYTYLNEQLARHYGVEDVYGSRFRRVAWEDDRRHGLLGHGSLLTITSYANRTSVVLRGKWVLENLLGTPPPAPPPNVPPLEENDGSGTPTSLREKMEQHRSNPVCASCHTEMDQLGFALEHFDAIGRWRDNDGGAAIDAAIDWADQTNRDAAGVSRGAGQPGHAVRADRHREAVDLRTRPRRELLRRAGGAAARARSGAGRLPLVVADPRHRRQHAVPDAAGARAGAVCGIHTWGCAPNPRHTLAGTPSNSAARAGPRRARLTARLVNRAAAGLRYGRRRGIIAQRDRLSR